jgi:hypothetical protein
MGHQPEPEKSSLENHYKQAIKIPSHGKRASCIGDGYLTVPAFEVLISLGFKIRKSYFLKAQKKAKIRPLKTPKNRGPKPPRKL